MKMSNRNTKKETMRLMEKLLADTAERFPSEEKDTFTKTVQEVNLESCLGL